MAATLCSFAGTLGVTPSPFDCWLAERGLHSFELRYDRAEATAARLADALTSAPSVTSVVYPGRADHPDRALAVDLFGARGGYLVTFTLAGGRAAANAFARAVPQLAFAPTLGDVATTVSHPASSSHRGLDPAARRALGITEGTLRLSVGIEEPDVLIAEVLAAINRAADNRATGDGAAATGDGAAATGDGGQ
jgi:cystathionine gamma-synthase